MLDLLFPKYCVSCRKIGSCLCTDCFSKISFDVLETCLVCNSFSQSGVTHKECRSPFVLDGASVSVVYNRQIQRLLSALAHNPFLSDVETMLLDLFYEGLIQKEFVTRFYEKSSRGLLFVPVPKRNSSQIEILAKGLSSRFGGGYKKLSQKEKIQSFKDVQLSSTRVQNTIILLVSDVLKTGLPLLEIAGVLKKNGAKEVWGIALASALS